MFVGLRQHQLAAWSSGMILASGARGPGLNSWSSPCASQTRSVFGPVHSLPLHRSCTDQIASCLGQDCSAALVDSGSDHRRLLAGVSGTCTCSGPEMALSLTGGCSSCRRGRPMTERARALHRVLCTCGCGTRPPRTMASSPRVPRWQCRCALPAGLV